MNTPGINEPELMAAVQRLLPDLIIALVKRAGGTLEIPVAEIDDVKGVMLQIGIGNNDKGQTLVFYIAGKVN